MEFPILFVLLYSKVDQGDSDSGGTLYIPFNWCRVRDSATLTGARLDRVSVATAISANEQSEIAKGDVNQP